MFDNCAPFVGVPKDAPAARNRFIYYGDHLVKMPGPAPGEGAVKTIFNAMYKFFTEPIFKGLMLSVLAEPRVKPRPSTLQDESVSDFFRRRFGDTIADNLISALFHGIYAGDIHKLSARTLLPRLWYLESRDKDSRGGVLLEMLDLWIKNHSLLDYRQQRGVSLVQNHEMKQVVDFAHSDTVQQIHSFLGNCNIYTFTDGLQQLADSIVSKLSLNPNVTISSGRTVQQISYNTEDRRFTLKTSPSAATQPAADTSTPAAKFDYTIATIRPSTLLASLATSPEPLAVSRRADQAFPAISHAVTVMVVNLYYSSPSLLPASLDGFGYLIPASVSLESNPERALGVIFSSSSCGIRGPNALQHRYRKTTEELRSLRETLEHHYETDFERGEKIKRLQRFKKQAAEENDDDVAAVDTFVGTMSATKMVKFAEADLRVRESFLQHHIDRVRKEELEARRREEEPGYSLEEDYDEVRIGQDTATGTKLTVMLGGHWWDGWEESDMPTEAEAVTMAKELLKRHLKVTDEPEVAKARLQRDCIPQYPVGYRDYMAAIHKDLLAPIGGKFDGRLKVAGTWWQGGVGVNDCVKKGRETAASLYAGWDECTGLEEYVKDEKWCLVNTRTGQIEPDMMSINR